MSARRYCLEGRPGPSELIVLMSDSVGPIAHTAPWLEAMWLSGANPTDYHRAFESVPTLGGAHEEMDWHGRCRPVDSVAFCCPAGTGTHNPARDQQGRAGLRWAAVWRGRNLRACRRACLRRSRCCTAR